MNAEEVEESALDLYEHAPCGYLSTDPDGLVIRVNRTFLEWTGYRSEQLVGLRRFQDLLSVGGRLYHETHYAPLLRMQGSVREIAVDIVRADGSRLPTLVNAVLKYDDEGEPRLIRATIFDATDRRRYERELVVARDRERLVRERAERLQRLSAMLAAAPDAGAVGRVACAELSGALGAARAGLALGGDAGGPRILHALGEPGPAPAAPAGPAFEPARAVLPVGTAHVDAVLWLELDPPRALGVEERSFAAACADQVTLALDRALLFEEQRDVAHRLQQALLAGAPPEDPRFDVAALYRPAGESLEVGGDWHDTFSVPGGKVGIAVGDVVGRGLTAASAMGQLRSAVRALAGAGLGPAQVLTHLDTFVEQVVDARYATLAYAEIDPDTGRMVFASAGHLPPLLLGPPRLYLEGGSPPLGVVLPGAPRGEAELALAPGDGFLLYTDGLVERRREPLDDGLARLVAAAGDREGAAPAELVDALYAELLRGAGGEDDVCLLCFELAARDADDPRGGAAAARV